VSSTLESYNPATGALLGAVEMTRVEDVQAVVDDVAQVQPIWAQLTLADRARYLERTAQVLIDEGDQIRDLIAAEQGKPRNEAFAMELLPTIDALQWIAREGQQLLADEKIKMHQLFFKLKKAAYTYEPLGVDRRDRAVELPVEHPLRRGRAGADGRQRRRAEAGIADAADRRADPSSVSSAPACLTG
jgi:acyl-CoA reductase-like NAD-dependent aldehyde dehydrogenase